MNELDAIAKEAAKAILHSYTIKIEQTEATIRGAIDKALEAVLTKEPRAQFEAWISSPPIERDVDRYDEVDEIAWPGQYTDYHVQLCWDAVIAMTEKLLETLKGNSSGTQAGNHPSAIDD